MNPERALTIPETSYQKPETRRALAYDPLFDIQAYRQLDTLPLEQHDLLKPQLSERTRTNLATNLGERFNVQVSQATFTIENNQLKSSQHSEPFLDVVKRGVEYRQTNGNPNDHDREQAELLGALRNQNILSHPNLNPNLKTVIISPRGGTDSDYQHNFFDVYEPQPFGQIVMTRYTSKMSYEDFFQAAQSLNPRLENPDQLTDEFFLANPLVTTKSTGEILDVLHPDEQTMDDVEYQLLIKAVTPLITSYINTLASGNYSEQQINLMYNTLLNVADNFVQKPQSRKQLLETSSRIDFVPNLILTYGTQPVRHVMTGCGLQKGSSIFDTINSDSPFSVAEFGKSCPECQSAANHFHCPRDKGGCGGKIPSGVGITTCPNCQLTKEQAGSNC